MPSLESDFAQNLALVEERIQRAAERSGRPRAGITLLAVSKKFPAERLAIAYHAGLRDFGENYVQDFAESSRRNFCGASMVRLPSAVKPSRP